MKKLPNYIGKHRKRAGLSQEEISFLLGQQDGASVCRCERFLRQPILPTAFGYEVIFNTPASELFSGVFQKVEQDVSGRAVLLMRKLQTSVNRPNGVMRSRKLNARFFGGIRRRKRVGSRPCENNFR